MRDELLTADALFRYHEHAFAAILPDTDVSTALPAAERIRAAIRSANFGGEHEEATASIGFAELRPGRTPEELVASAEMALYRPGVGRGPDVAVRRPAPARPQPGRARARTDAAEWDVLADPARRRTEQEIAGRLGIRAGTVRSHKARIRRKLHGAANVRLSDFASQNFAALTRRARRTMDSGDEAR